MRRVSTWTVGLRSAQTRLQAWMTGLHPNVVKALLRYLMFLHALASATKTYVSLVEAQARIIEIIVQSISLDPWGRRTSWAPPSILVRERKYPFPRLFVRPLITSKVIRNHSRQFQPILYAINEARGYDHRPDIERYSGRSCSGREAKRCELLFVNNCKKSGKLIVEKNVKLIFWKEIVLFRKSRWHRICDVDRRFKGFTFFRIAESIQLK